MTVSWGNDSHPTGVVKPVNGIPTSHSPQQLCIWGHEHAGIILQLAEILICKVSKENKIEHMFSLNDSVTSKEQNPIALMFY